MSSLEEATFTVAIIGGGVSRCGVARDAVWIYSGAPLYNDGASKAQEVTSDYVLTLDKLG